MPTSRRAWGWHQLDPRWAERLAASARIAPGSWVLDIGAGTGAITEHLVAARARVIAVESHPRRARELRARFGDRVTVVRADARDLRLPRRPFHIVANPPFGITAALLARVLHSGSRLQSAYLILQEQAAHRWAGPHAPAAARWKRSFTASVGSRIPRTAFRPRPLVDERVLVITRR